MRTAVLSDIHGNAIALEAVIEHMRTMEVQCVVFLGDLIAKGPSPQRCYDLMVSQKPLVWVKGNTDAWLDDAMMGIAGTSDKERRLLTYYDYMVHHMDGKSMDAVMGQKLIQSIRLGHFEALCFHGGLEDYDMDGRNLEPERIREIKEDVILLGHTHVYDDQIICGKRFINPGSVGIGNGGKASYLLMDTSQGFKITRQLVDYNLTEAIKEAERSDFPFLEDYKAILVG